MNHPRTKEWRCSACNTLLGIQRDDHIHLRYKQAEYAVTGTVVATCRQCSRRNEISCPQPPAAATGAAA
jgi:RNase P subunit RPR2